MQIDIVVVVSFCAGFLISVILFVFTFLRVFKHLDKITVLMDTLKNDNIKTRFMATSMKDSVSMVNTTLEDLQSQIDILRHTQFSQKTEET